MPQIPLGVLERLLQLSGAFQIHTDQALEELSQASQLHRQMKPVEPMLQVGTQVALQVT